MTPRVLVVVMMLAATGSSGCLFFDWGGCGPYYHGATWQEPGMFKALANESTRHPVDQGAFPFEHAEADEVWGPFYGVSSVWFDVGEGHGRGETLQVMLHPGHSEDDTLRYGGNGTYVYARGGDTIDDAVWRDTLTRFLDATGVVPGERDEWIDALLAARTVAGEGWEGGDRSRPVTLISAHRAVQAEPDLTALAEGLGPMDPPMGASRAPTFEWSTENGTWRFRVELAVRDLALESSAPGETEELTVNAADAVAVTIQQDIGGNETAVKEWLRGRFAAHDLPAPSFRGFQVEASIC